MMFKWSTLTKIDEDSLEWRGEKHKKGGLNCKAEILKQSTRYFYPGSFDLKLLQSTRQGDFASLQRGLNSLYSTEYYRLL